MEKPPKQAYGPTINRISDVMAHTNRYAFHGVTNLAKEARVNASSISRLINGKINPSFALVARVTTALERHIGRRIDPRDLISEHGEFLTQFACDLTGCRGCFPDNARDEFGAIKAAFADISPGKWVTSRHPKGFKAQKGGQ